jgi:hypothetical protein
MASARPTQINAYDDGIDRWAMVRAAPAPGVAGHVRSYCSYWEETASFAARRELAGTTGVLIYALGEPLEIVGADGRTIVLKVGEGFSGGIADGTSISRGLGPQAGIQVDLPLESLAALLGAPVAAPTLVTRFAMPRTTRPASPCWTRSSPADSRGNGRRTRSRAGRRGG